MRALLFGQRDAGRRAQKQKRDQPKQAIGRPLQPSALAQKVRLDEVEAARGALRLFQRLRQQRIAQPQPRQDAAAVLPLAGRDAQILLQAMRAIFDEKARQQRPAQDQLVVRWLVKRPPLRVAIRHQQTLVDQPIANRKDARFFAGIGEAQLALKDALACDLAGRNHAQQQIAKGLLLGRLGIAGIDAIGPLRQRTADSAQAVIVGLRQRAIARPPDRCAIHLAEQERQQRQRARHIDDFIEQAIDQRRGLEEQHALAGRAFDDLAQLFARKWWHQETRTGRGIRRQQLGKVRLVVRAQGHHPVHLAATCLLYLAQLSKKLVATAAGQSHQLFQLIDDQQQLAVAMARPPGMHR